MAWRRILALAPARIFRALRSRARSGHDQLARHPVRRGRRRGLQRAFRQIYPQPGWVEHDPREIFETQRDVAREALQKKNVSMRDLACVGIANQRETTIVWDRQSGEPIHNAIVWQDRRTADF